MLFTTDATVLPRAFIQCNEGEALMNFLTSSMAGSIALIGPVRATPVHAVHAKRPSIVPILSHPLRIIDCGTCFTTGKGRHAGPVRCLDAEG